MNWCNEYKQKLMNAEEAVRLINSGERVYVGTSSSVAFVLMKALWDRREELENIEITSALVLKPIAII